MGIGCVDRGGYSHPRVVRVAPVAELAAELFARLVVERPPRHRDFLLAALLRVSRCPLLLLQCLQLGDVRPVLKEAVEGEPLHRLEVAIEHPAHVASVHRVQHVAHAAQNAIILYKHLRQSIGRAAVRCTRGHHVRRAVQSARGAPAQCRAWPR